MSLPMRGTVSVESPSVPSELPPLPEPLPGPVVDTHCHLDATEEYSGLDPHERSPTRHR